MEEGVQPIWARCSLWFIKEKNLVPEDLFNQRKLQNILKNIDPKESTYYKAILQNGEVARNGMVS